jgi:UDP-N-acetylenolpyruvoylglucosamine reductase
MFKNPAAIPAGRLIDELGLKGTRIGGARISLEHGNFLVNDGGATAADVLALIELLRTKARAERGIELHTEVEIVGGPASGH